MSDTFKNLDCPACGKEMNKVFSSQEGVNIDICLNGCGGIWFDNREFKKFDEADENIEEITDKIVDKVFEKTDSSLTRICPVCKTKMVKNYSSVKKQIEIDECYSCGGKFLDNGELEKFRSEYDNEQKRSQDTVKLMYSVVGMELKNLDEEVVELAKKRSATKRLFDKIFFGQS